MAVLGGGAVSYERGTPVCTWMIIGARGAGWGFRTYKTKKKRKERWYVRLIDSCITQLMAQGPSRTYNESKEEEKRKKRKERWKGEVHIEGFKRVVVWRLPPEEPLFLFFITLEPRVE